MIGVAIGQHLARDLGVTGGAGKLIGDLAVPLQAEPRQPVEDRGDRGLGRAGAVGVLDAQEERAAVMAREQPVEERRAGAADVQEAGRRGGETGDYGHCIQSICRISAGKERCR